MIMQRFYEILSHCCLMRHPHTLYTTAVVSPGTRCAVDDLEPGETYDFRVSAVNEHGQSEPLTTTKSVVAKYPFGESLTRRPRDIISTQFCCFLYMYNSHVGFTRQMYVIT